MLNKALLGTPKEFKVTIGSQTHCTASTAKTAYMPGDLVTINISYNTGYHNATVATSTGTPVSKVNNNTYTFVMPSKDVVITASASVMSFTITVNKNAGGNVSVKSVANYGERVTVTMSPLEGYSVGSVSASGASLSGSGNTRTFTMRANNVTINVTFNFVYHTLLTVGQISNRYGIYSGEGGRFSRTPYWNSRDNPLQTLVYSSRGGTYITYFRSLTINGHLIGNEGISGDVLNLRANLNKTIPLVFDPPLQVISNKVKRQSCLKSMEGLLNA